ncbi:MAG TPA: hypothetical protein VIG46_13640 [Candidatus Baltobacteraceae bacterium]|jgi:hypothetical protein
MKSVAVLLTLASLCALPAAAATTRHDIYNATQMCAWMTLDIASPISPWKNKHAGFLKPGEHVTWTINAEKELKIRAEPRKTADCSSGKAGDLSIVEKSAWNVLGSSETTLAGQEGAFRLHWGKP